MEHSHLSLLILQKTLLVLLAFSVGAAIVISGHFFPKLNGGFGKPRAIQAIHKRPTPRLGGLAIFSALVLSSVFAPGEVSTRYGLFMLSASVLFFVGLVEDIGIGVSPMKRLLAAAFASILVIISLEVWLPRTGVPFLEPYMQNWIVGIGLTLLVTVGMANGFNLIDGVNGLAAFTACVSAAALALIAERAGYVAMVQLATMLFVCILGFLLLNYPFGLIFLGDAGAYTLGFVLSWFGIAILLNVPEASPWAILLTMFWPVADTVLAMFRRARRKAPTMKPDRLHVHQLVMRTLEIYVLGRGRRHLANPLTTLVLAPFVIAPAIAGAMFWNDPQSTFVAVILFSVAFALSYSFALPVLSRFRRLKGCPPIRRRRATPKRHTGILPEDVARL
jgi:UDP-GlcNAc:undecaprenyl-phosphate/decaprenyl-phosphate GlcNAc-1-phosphate transferase